MVLTSLTPVEIDDPRASAKAAGLRYVTDRRPGIRRERKGDSFEYLKPDGEVLDDPEAIARIRALAIPPAWTDVWISPVSKGHLQATGRDAKGRKQYRYHAKFREIRDTVKYDRLLEFGKALPLIRERIEEHLKLRGFPREKVLALMAKLLDETQLRVGNEEYRIQNKSFGLTTLRNRHAIIRGSTVMLKFRGKSGKDHLIKLTDKRLARLMKKCQELPGQELFQYLDEDGARHSVDSQDVNDYIREVSGGDFTAKDFRTWNGTLLAMCELRLCQPPASEREAKSNIKSAIEVVSKQLGNTVTVARKAYVHPSVVDCYQSGKLADIARDIKEEEGGDALKPNERCLIAFLETLHVEATVPMKEAA